MSTSKHLAVLKDVKLVSARQVGRSVLYRTEAPAIQTHSRMGSSFERYWINQLNDVKEMAERASSEEGTKAPPKPGLIDSNHREGMGKGWLAIMEGVKEAAEDCG